MNAMTPPRVAWLAMILVALGCGQSPPAEPRAAKPAKEKTESASRKIEKPPAAKAVAPAAKPSQWVKLDAMLRQRAQAFLKKPIPVAVEYDPSAISERVIREYADQGTVELDAVSGEVLEAQIRTARASADASDGPQAAYYRELAEVLDAILHKGQPTSSK